MTDNRIIELGDLSIERVVLASTIVEGKKAGFAGSGQFKDIPDVDKPIKRFAKKIGSLWYTDIYWDGDSEGDFEGWEDIRVEKLDGPVIWTMDYEGRWSVKASWAGNSKRLGSESQWVNYDIMDSSGMGPCIIATATYGSELSPEVQFLRGFRDNTVMASYTGTQFIEVFNRIYYSFSPGVASTITDNEMSRNLMKDFLYPLMGILHVGQSVNSLFSFSPDFGIIMFCFVVSCLIGLVYLIPLNLLINIFSKTVVPAFVIRVTSFLWIGSAAFLFVAEISKLDVLLMASGGAFVIITAALTTLAITRMISKHAPKIVL